MLSNSYRIKAVHHWMQEGWKLLLLNWIQVVSIAAVVALGLHLRLEDLEVWKEHPSEAFYNGAPVLTTFDGYYYLRYAVELEQGAYDEIDELRAVPRRPPRPFPPPLLSVLAAGAIFLTGGSPDWIAALFPAFAGVLLFIPLFLIGRYFGGFTCGIGAGLIALCSPYYVQRSSIGRFDTDCGNVTFLMLAVLLAISLATAKGRARYWYLGASFLNLVLFLLWWDMAQEVVVGICLLPHLFAYLFLAGPKRKDLPVILLLAASLVLCLTLWKGVGFWSRFPDAIGGLFLYISKSGAGDFPNIGVTISEQARFSIPDLVEMAAGNWYVFVLSCAGMAALFVKAPRKGMQLVVPLSLGVLAVLYAKRFTIFITPVVALGAGYLFSVLVDEGARLKSRFVKIALLAGGYTCFTFVIWSLVSLSVSRNARPVESPHVIEGMEWARTETPPDSVVWAWWDHGYPMMYWSQRGTISDGAFHFGELATINAFGYSSADYRQAANWMQFYVARGTAGFHQVYDKVGGVSEGLDVIKRIFALGPAESAAVLAEKGFEPLAQWLPFFFPPPEARKPLYLFVDARLMSTSYWWYWLGTWVPEEKQGLHPLFRSFYGIRKDGNRLYGSPPFELDLSEGVYRSGDAALSLSKVVFREDNKWKSINYRSEGAIFQYDRNSDWGALCSDDIFQSVFNKLFFLRTADVKYFKPMLLKTATYQIWEVSGDALTGIENH